MIEVDKKNYLYHFIGICYGPVHIYSRQTYFRSKFKVTKNIFSL